MAGSRKPPSSSAEPLERRVERELVRYVPRGARVTLALSGGLDSVVLLDLLAALAPRHPFALDCLHIDHGLSPNARRWAAFARRAAREHGVRCKVKRAELAPHAALGREGAARAARYALLEGTRADFVALAQHRDDQAETVLLQLVRGAGPAGLAAMPVARRATAGAPAFIRPMLGAGRAEIEAYARRRGLAWVEDESNDDVTLARNFVRHRVMPLLHELNPQAAANLARSASLAAEADEMVRTLAAADLAAASVGGLLQATALQRLAPARAAAVLRVAIAAAGGAVPDRRRLHEMLAQLCEARADARVSIRAGPIEIRRYRGGIHFVAPRAALPDDFRACWPGRLAWPLRALGGVLRFERATGAGLSRAAMRESVVEVRLRRGGERLRVRPGGPRRELKALLRESALAPWERERLPLLYCDGVLAWVPGVGIAVELVAGAGQPGLVPLWQPAPPAGFGETPTRAPKHRLK